MRRRPGRTLGVVVGYAVAAVAIISMLTFLTYEQGQLSQVLAATGTRFMLFTPAPKSIPYRDVFLDTVRQDEGLFVRDVETSYFGTDLMGALRNIASVRAITPYLLYRLHDPHTGRLINVGGFELDGLDVVRVTCCDPEDVTDGQFLAAGDIGKVMLDAQYAEDAKVKVGETYTLSGLSFTVAGIVDSQDRPARADVYLLRQDAQRVLASIMRIKPGTKLKLEVPEGGSCADGKCGTQPAATAPPPPADLANVILVRAVSPQAVAEASKEIKKRMPVAVQSGVLQELPSAEVFDLPERSIWALFAVVALASMLLAWSVQNTAVAERRRELGLLKAWGWTSDRVLGLLLAESTWRAFLGGAIGCAAAVLLFTVAPMKSLAGITTQAVLMPSALVLGAVLGATVLTAALGSFIGAAYAAYRLPAALLRDEA
jgi:putative ABC transport system permease protein